MKLTGVCLITENVPTLVRFYTAVLRSEAVGDDTHSEFTLGGMSLAIFSKQGMEGMAPGSTGQDSGYGRTTIAFEVENVDSEYERLLDLNVLMVKPLQTHPWGARAFWFRDPDGNIVDFYARVK